MIDVIPEKRFAREKLAFDFLKILMRSEKTVLPPRQQVMYCFHMADLFLECCEKPLDQIRVEQEMRKQNQERGR